MEDLMNLKVLLPSFILLEEKGIRRIMVETDAGSIGLLPHRLDCAAVVTPGILIYETYNREERYLANDTGILIKYNRDVTISVRNAVKGKDLGYLQQTLQTSFFNLDEQEKKVRSVLVKLESSCIRSMQQFINRTP